jgi:hypothetical protein
LNDKDLLVAGEILVNSEAYENLTMLCDRFGSRFFATQQEKDGAEFLASRLRAYGLQNVRLEPYTDFGWVDGRLTKLWSWKRETASLELLKPVTQQFSCVSLTYAPSTPSDGITAEIFNLERGNRTYLLANKKEIKGKLVLDGNYTKVTETAFMRSDPTDLYLPTLYGYLAQFEAAGLICTNRNYGGIPITGPARWGQMGEIPACGISKETSRFILRQMIKSPAMGKLNVKNTYAEGATSYNVIADLPGRTHPEEIILVGGHFDGFDISVGAMDDAAGACVVLEAARAIAKHAPALKRTLRFCCFSGEEVGLNGSTGYVINHSHELDKIRLMINTDSAGISAKTGHGYEVCGPEELIPYLEGVLKEIGTFDREWEMPRVAREVMPEWDHWAFYMRGIPTAHFRDLPTDPIDWLYSHTTVDTVDKVNVKGIKDAAAILALTLIRIADEDEIPVKHTPSQKILGYLEENGIAEDLRVEKRWRRELSS